jgi:hypothetical protein
MSFESYKISLIDKSNDPIQTARRRSGRLFVRIGLVLLVLSLGGVVIIKNVKVIVNNPILGVNVVFSQRAKLIREIEGVDSFSKQELINLDRGDGMRFLAFARQTLSVDSILVFPAEQFDEAQGDTILGPVPLQHFVVTLHPRRFLTDKYDFRLLPFTDSALIAEEGRFRVFHRDYHHSRKHYVFRVFVSPDVHRYRFFMTTAPITGRKDYGSELTFILYPDGDEP